MGKGRRAFHLQLTIPPNTTAKVFLPARSADEVQEGGGPVTKSRGVKVLGQESGCLVLEITSGKYNFAVSPQRPGMAEGS